MIHEQWDNTSKEGEYSAVIAERFMVKVEGADRASMCSRARWASVDVAGLAALKDEGVKPN